MDATAYPATVAAVADIPEPEVWVDYSSPSVTDIAPMIAAIQGVRHDVLHPDKIVRYSAEEGSPGFLIFKMNEDETEILDGSGVGLLDEG